MPDFQTREAILQADEADGELIPCTLATEWAVDRGGYDEVLSCRHGDVDLTRVPLPLIVQHDHTRLNIGVIEQISVDQGRVRGLARFGSSAQAREILADVKAGIVRSLSVGYEILETISKSGRTVRFAWRPYECSAVSVPADPMAGFYRSSSMKGTIMSDFIEVTENDTQLSRSQRRGATQATDAERERAREITAIGRMHNVRELADKAIDAGTPLDSFRLQVLDHLKSSGTLRPAESPEIGMTRKEVERFSFVRAINAQIDPNYARREAGFELEVSKACEQAYGKQPQGLFVPGEVLRYQRRDLVTSTPAAGGYLVATDHLAESFIALLRKRTYVIAMGATTLADLNGNAAIPSQTGAGSAFWVAEGGAPTESQQTFGQVPLTPKTVGAYTDFTRRMMLQSSPDIESMVRADLAQVVAVEVDRAAISGSGTSNEPLGILNTSGIGAVAIGTDGGPITWEKVLELEEALATLDADQGMLGYLTNPAVRRALKGTTKVASDAGAGFIWEPGREGYGMLNGYRAAASNNIPGNLTKGAGTNLSACIFANWRDLVIAQWGGLDIFVDKFTHGTSGGTRVVALLDLDIAVRRVASFAAIKDATT
ncbi:MAG: phage major capsid protein [Pseudomonadota bacterium]